MIKEQIIAQVDQLVQSGQGLLGIARRSNYGSYYEESQKVPVLSWKNSVEFAVHTLLPEGHLFKKNLQTLYSAEKDLFDSVQEIIALLMSFKEALAAGYLFSWEYEVSATDFSDFLDHAKFYHGRNQKEYAAVIASAVLEDTIKKIAKKHDLDTSGTLDPLVERLAQANVFSPIRKKELLVLLGIRNSALHAKWNEIDNRLVGKLIEEVKQLIDKHLYE